MTEISFLFNIHYNTELNKFVKYELWRMEKYWAMFLNVNVNMTKPLIKLVGITSYVARCTTLFFPQDIAEVRF
jgi:hypothetical protein